MRILFISSLFPDASVPGHGLHNAGVVRRLGARHEVRVIAPRPRPVLAGFVRRWTAPVCTAEDVALAPAYPRTAYVPKIGSLVNHRLYAAALRRAVAATRPGFCPDVLLAAWLFPDGCAAVRVAVECGLPCVLVAQGSDVHQHLAMPIRRRVILAHARRAAAVIARSADLAARLRRHGLVAPSPAAIPNGVDLERFRVADAVAAVRDETGIAGDARVVLYVGNLLEVKNPALLIEAFARLRARQSEHRWLLILVGDGPLNAALRARVTSLGIQEHVRFTGVQPPADVARYMQSADVLCVPSRDEGIPNVIREAMACGLPTVASRVGGVPEVLDDPAVGELVPPGDVERLAAALGRWAIRDRDRQQIRARAERFSWAACIDGYETLLTDAIRRHRPDAAGRHPGGA